MQVCTESGERMKLKMCIVASSRISGSVGSLKQHEMGLCVQLNFVINIMLEGDRNEKAAYKL